MNALDYSRSVVVVVAVLAVAAMVEALIPIFPRPSALPGRHRVNLAMTARTLLFALLDRVLGTFVPTERASSVRHGLDDVSPSDVRSFGALLAMPWRKRLARDTAAAELVA